MDIQKIRENLELKFRVRQAANHDRWSRAKADFEAILEMVKADYHPARIYCWGSLLDQAGFNEHSDIDIALEGVADPGAYFELLGKATSLTGFPVDIVQMEKIDPVFAAQIRRKGKLMYEREI